MVCVVITKKNGVSIALCTYNGQSYLKEQLDSIAAQSQLPDELVICDDRSTDNTIAIATEFAKNAPFLVRIFENETTLMVTKNFEKALQLCQHDLVFLCDQDDIWYKTKIQELSDFLVKNPEYDVVFSNADLIDANAELLNEQLWDKLRFWDLQQKQWVQGYSTEVLLQGNRVTGCTVAFRRSFLAHILPFPTHIPVFIHDTWIAMAASVQNKVQLYPAVLTGYRQHANQQVGVRPKEARFVTFRERLTRNHDQKLAPIVADRDYWQLVYDTVSQYIPNASGLVVIEQKLIYLKMRSTLPANRFLRIAPVLKHLFNGNYFKYADQEAGNKGGILTFLADILEG
ncbi:MAG: glycosyltransferase family 2 protein [Cytophagia bacterium]|nr:MAG: glycosyltransferase family 2 protein [Cytophagales bacterium]TAG41239.1 MAG: glycosyltransferase family 2 protein [Cytophagia bacterium]TAG66730.1 MAG: glycosyltransferase family 2 protein [Runella slithyformis]TAG82924.1 MAG: glycosyltransferase family 2 protein [Cytophagales bacterium]